MRIGYRAMTKINNSIIRILSIDPGGMATGWAIIDYDIQTNLKTVERYGTITGKSLLKNQKDLQEHFEKRHIIVWELEPAIIEIMIEFSPQFVAVEEPFAHLYIQAYAALIIIVMAIRTAVRKTLGRDVYLIAPKEAKKAISKDGTASKDLVSESIAKNPYIIIKQSKHNKEEDLTEHAADAIAVGVAFIQNQLTSILAIG